jgi:hypothetical protein
MVAIASETSPVGTWKLLSREDVTSDGQRRMEPKLGSDPVSYLMYDASGHFAVQFMRAGGQHLHRGCATSRAFREVAFRTADSTNELTEAADSPSPPAEYG